MSRRSGGGGVPWWLIAALLVGALIAAYVERDAIKALLTSAGMIVGATEGAGAVP